MRTVNDQSRARAVLLSRSLQDRAVFDNSYPQHLFWTAQYLSLFVDDLFRKGHKGMSSDVEIDQGREQVVMLFRFLQDKDVFDNFYKQHLPRRLLSGHLLADEAEKAMNTKMKSECEHEYTAKLEGMF